MRDARRQSLRFNRVNPRNSWNSIQEYLRVDATRTAHLVRAVRARNEHRSDGCDDVAVLIRDRDRHGAMRRGESLSVELRSLVSHGLVARRRQIATRRATMKLATYERIRAVFASTPCDAYPDLDAIRAECPECTLDALVSIYSQESSRKIRATHGKHVRAIEAHAKRYVLGEDVFSIAANVDFPACQLMRLLLEYLLGVGHKSVGGVLRDPFGRIPEVPERGTPAAEYGAKLCARLRADVERVVAWDHQASPAVDVLRHNAGKEYEDLLEELLTNEGIPFVTEQDLRADGHARTPDIKLEVPIAVKGRIVNWIDSKASFSDPVVHVEKGTEQFQGYVNRFGPGMVIYWHGIIDELNTDPNVLLVDAFPDTKDIVKLKMI